MNINKRIELAETLPAEFYRSEQVFESVKEKIFASSWLWAGDVSNVSNNGDTYPFCLLPQVLDDPLLFTRDKNGQLHCLSNVCTHRGKVLVEKTGNSKIIQCGYHGRCFSLNGQFKRQVAFEGAENFPCEKDNLPKIPFEEWLGMLFVNFNPKVDFKEMVQPIMDRIGWMPLNEMEFDPTTSKDYFVEANWALYCDNYLEGLHVPFVHPELNEALDFKNYDYEIHPYCNLQLGIADEGQQCFDIPEGHPDYGKNIYAYYYWLFPNLMLNFYPFGLSLNIVNPIAHNRTIIQFRTYQFKNNPLTPDDYCIDATEMQDEAVVESVQQGIQSRFYDRGRFSPSHEKAVHHFHRLVQEFMEGD